MISMGEISMVPTVIAERDGYRLVKTMRDSKSWPNGFDLVLEQHSKDAMGNERWIFIDSWYLSPRDDVNNNRDNTATLQVALKMLADPGPILEDKKRRQ